MTELSMFSNPLLLGFDELERMLERASQTSGDGFPPYNIERLRSKEGNVEKLRITLAVAGFGEGDLDISLEENQLTIEGKQEDAKQREYLHRGIAARRFKRTFVLAEGIEVAGARLEDGLLSIDLNRIEPERVVRTIKINGSPKK